MAESRSVTLNINVTGEDAAKVRALLFGQKVPREAMQSIGRTQWYCRSDSADTLRLLKMTEFISVICREGHSVPRTVHLNALDARSLAAELLALADQIDPPRG